MKSVHCAFGRSPNISRSGVIVGDFVQNAQGLLDSRFVFFFPFCFLQAISPSSSTGPSGPRRILAHERFRSLSLKDFRARLTLLKLVRRFSRLMSDVCTLAAVDALAAYVTEVVCRVEFSLARGAFPPELCRISSMQVLPVKILKEKYQCSIFHVLFDE